MGGRDVLAPIFLESMMITNEQLRQTFLSEQMKHYLEKKLSPLSSEEVEVRIEEALKYLNMASHRSGNIPFAKLMSNLLFLS